MTPIENRPSDAGSGIERRKSIVRYAAVLAALVITVAVALVVRGRTAPAAPTAGSATLTSAFAVSRVDADQAIVLIEAGEAVLYDVRTADLYAERHAEGALSLPENDIDRLLSSLPGEKALILYCT